MLALLFFGRRFDIIKIDNPWPAKFKLPYAKLFMNELLAMPLYLV